MQKIYKTYGLSMKGSKRKLADRIVSLFPRATHLYDLFCGGSAISHCALLKNKYQHIHINDINPMMPQAFIKALQGGFDDEDRWISREDFFRLKDTDPYVAVVWSFGNNLHTYLYSKEIEPLKKAIHYAMFFSDYSLGKELGHDLSFIDPIQDLQKRYLAVKHYFNRLDHQQQSFEGGTQRMQSIEANERLNTFRNITHWKGCQIQSFKKKMHKRPSEMESHERRNVVASLAIPRAAAQSAQIFGGADSTYHVLCA